MAQVASYGLAEAAPWCDHVRNVAVQSKLLADVEVQRVEDKKGNPWLKTMVTVTENTGMEALYEEIVVPELIKQNIMQAKQIDNLIQKGIELRSQLDRAMEAIELLEQRLRQRIMNDEGAMPGDRSALLMADIIKAEVYNAHIK